MKLFRENKKHLAAMVAAAILVVVSWFVAIFYWDKLPGIIPTHFGINGQPDGWSSRSFWSVFFIPVIQTVLFGSFVFLYIKPQYSDMPTTLWLMTMDEKVKDHAFSLIRTMLVVVSLMIGFIFTYLTYAIVFSAFEKTMGLNPWILFAILGAMILWLIFWTIKVYKVTREAIKNKK